MIRVTEWELDYLEARRPGVKELILRFENAVLPPCPHCGSAHTADVQVGVIGLTISIACATTKFKLLPNHPVPGPYFCNDCQRYFDPREWN